VGVGRVGVCMLCTCVREEGDDGEGTGSGRHLFCHTHLDTSVSWKLLFECVIYYFNRYIF